MLIPHIEDTIDGFKVIPLLCPSVVNYAFMRKVRGKLQGNHTTETLEICKMFLGDVIYTRSSRTH